jgi:pyruvate dehydrogenase E1 component beta subunit
MEEDVPDVPYFIKLGKAFVRRPGTDVSVIAFGSMIPAALQAADDLAREGVSAEVVDLRCLMPLDMETVIASAAKTRRLVVAEPGWRMYGAAAEIVAGVVESPDVHLKSPPRRVTWPHSHIPTSSRLEAAYYPTKADIIAACKATVGG